ncbi:MAG: 50S ribosomal protein L10 [Ignavibacteriales bacterium]|jgi:Ribosomal protein L10|nr:MAG: 50S ribosomal protein L10 [Ignavibacteriaceae bacterium]MBW7873048.1 50S ribosomal protein L10 [Ignavibacteria bacterium]MCZ2142691.1 50S ribosomal protein L10 [Ignavibacteriales bacterium]OQY71321.1 MAG: 50S ribosomal protein L10 [Ignavibacteriales bacterium UTCHB3]MBV6443787.1 50S ribosomal protein L10 [Ignavibacteriaceae bacterium]
MNKGQKGEVIAEIVELLNDSTAIYLTDYSGVNVEQISKLRREFRKEGVVYKVFKNSLFQRALKESGKYPKLEESLVGMTGFAFASDNPVAAAKIIKKFNDDNKKFGLKACYIETQYYSGDQLELLSKLPTKAEIIAGILGSINAPASGIVGAINAVMRDLVSVIDEVAKKKAA